MAEQIVTLRAKTPLRASKFDVSGTFAGGWASGGTQLWQTLVSSDDDWADALQQGAQAVFAASTILFACTTEIAMTPADVVYVTETAAHDPEIEDINAEAFGPGRFTRAAHAIREGGPHRRDLSFVALVDGKVVGSVRMTPIAAGEGRALLLGPLAVRPAFKNLGIGRRLVALALEAARKDGWGLVILVGDAPYYAPLGFSIVIPKEQAIMPRPVDPARFLACELVPGSLSNFVGDVVHADLAKPALRLAAE